MKLCVYFVDQGKAEFFHNLLPPSHASADGGLSQVEIVADLRSWGRGQILHYQVQPEASHMVQITEYPPGVAVRKRMPVASPVVSTMEYPSGGWLAAPAISLPLLE